MEGSGSSATMAELGTACASNNAAASHHEESIHTNPPLSSFSRDDYEDGDGDRCRDYRNDNVDDRVVEDGEIEDDEDEEDEDDEEENTTPRRNQNITPKRRQFNVSESMYKSVLVHSASKRLQETLWEEIRKDDEVGVTNQHELGDSERENNAAVDLQPEDHELPEELVDSLGMISLANAAEMHRGKEGGHGLEEHGASSPHPLPPASTLLNLSSGPEQIIDATATTSANFSSPIEVITTDAHSRGQDLDLAGQISQLTSYSQALGNMPATAFDYLRLYDSQVLNNNSVIIDSESDENVFPTNGFYDFQR